MFASHRGGQTAALQMGTAILDIDGALVDTNYHHTLSWARAFAHHEIAVALWRIHRHIGMGGDQLVPAVCGEEVERRLGDRIREGEHGEYMRLIEEVRPMEGARELIVQLKDRGHTVVLASSAKEDEVDHYLELLNAHDLADAWTTSADVDQTKPAPDLVDAALNAVHGAADSAVMIGDTPWDVQSARHVGVETITVITGGFSEQELTDAGAVAVFESVAELRDQLDQTRLR
ncbi:MAG: HAD family hydrolase [Solirubrobacteraceae bacterium]